MIDIKQTIKRAKKLKSVKYQEEIACFVGLSPSNFSTRKGRGTLVELFIEFAFHENVNLDWLFYGRGKIYVSEMDDFLQKAEYILHADHPKITPILKGNIDISHDNLMLCMEKEKHEAKKKTVDRD